MRTSVKIVIGVLTMGTIGVIGACGGYNDDRGIGDAPVNQLPDREINVVPNADGYPNIGYFCIGVNGIYTTTREAPPVVIVNDPNCEDPAFTGG